MELNPEHPATQEMRDLWHKMVAILMIKFGVDQVEVTTEDLEKLLTKFPGDTPCVLFFSKGEKITLQLLPQCEAKRRTLQ